MASSFPAAQRARPRDRAGVDARYRPIGFLARVVAHLEPAGAAGRIGHVRAPLIQDQVEAGAQPVPVLLEGRDTGVAGTDLEGDGGPP